MNHYFYNNFNEETNTRDFLQEKFALSFAKSDRNSLRQQYKELRQLEFNSEFEFSNETTDISVLAENITTACDILLSEMNTTFVFCGNDTSHIYGNPRFITKAILNLLSNAYLYGSGNLVTVKTTETEYFVKLEVQNGGNFADTFSFGKGLSFVKKVCQNSNGNFFIEWGKNYTRAIMVFPKAENKFAENDKFDFCDLLTDRISPVYVEFFGMEYH